MGYFDPINNLLNLQILENHYGQHFSLNLIFPEFARGKILKNVLRTEIKIIRISLKLKFFIVPLNPTVYLSV